MLPFLIFLAFFILLRLLAGGGTRVERASAAAQKPPREQSSIDEQPGGLVFSGGGEPAIYYNSPRFEDPYEEWHYYRHHPHLDELAGDLRQNFEQEYASGILSYGDRHNAEVIDGAWRSE